MMKLPPQSQFNFFLIISQSILILFTVVFYLLGGFLSHEMTTIILFIAPLLSLSATLMIKNFILNEEDTQDVGEPPMKEPLTLIYGIPSLFTVFLMAIVSLKAFNRGFTSFEQFKIILGGSEIAFGVYLGVIWTREQTKHMIWIREQVKQKLYMKAFYVDIKRIEELKQLHHPNFDLQMLIQLCEELNYCHFHQCYLSIAILVRAILDHVPPIFGVENFDSVANNYKGSKSFKGSMQNLSKSLKNIADSFLHTHIRKEESLPNFTQVNFSNDLDVLLQEIIRVLKDLK